MDQIRVQLQGLPLIQNTHVDVAVRAMVDSLHGKLWAAEQKQHRMLHEVRVAARKESEEQFAVMTKAHKQAMNAKQSEVDNLQQKLIDQEQAHETEIRTLTVAHEAATAKLTGDHEVVTVELRRQHDQDVLEMELSHETRVRQMDAERAVGQDALNIELYELDAQRPMEEAAAKAAVEEAATAKAETNIAVKEEAAAKAVAAKAAQEVVAMTAAVKAAQEAQEAQVAQVAVAKAAAVKAAEEVAAAKAAVKAAQEAQAAQAAVAKKAVTKAAEEVATVKAAAKAAQEAHMEAQRLTEVTNTETNPAAKESKLENVDRGDGEASGKGGGGEGGLGGICGIGDNVGGGRDDGPWPLIELSVDTIKEGVAAEVGVAVTSEWVSDGRHEVGLYPRSKVAGNALQTVPLPQGGHASVWFATEVARKLAAGQYAAVLQKKGSGQKLAQSNLLYVITTETHPPPDDPWPMIELSIDSLEEGAPTEMEVSVTSEWVSDGQYEVGLYPRSYTAGDVLLAVALPEGHSASVRFAPAEMGKLAAGTYVAALQKKGSKKQLAKSNVLYVEEAARGVPQPPPPPKPDKPKPKPMVPDGTLSSTDDPETEPEPDSPEPELPPQPKPESETDGDNSDDAHDPDDPHEPDVPEESESSGGESSGEDDDKSMTTASMPQKRAALGNEEAFKSLAAAAKAGGPKTQKAFEENTHISVELNFGHLVSSKCCTLNGGPDAAASCKSCGGYHLWFCHKCGSLQKGGSCQRGCDWGSFGWSCITKMCSGGNCPCKSMINQRLTEVAATGQYPEPEPESETDGDNSDDTHDHSNDDSHDPDERPDDPDKQDDPNEPDDPEESESSNDDSGNESETDNDNSDDTHDHSNDDSHDPDERPDDRDKQDDPDESDDPEESESSNADSSNEDDAKSTIISKIKLLKEIERKHARGDQDCTVLIGQLKEYLKPVFDADAALLVAIQGSDTETLEAAIAAVEELWPDSPSLPPANARLDMLFPPEMREVRDMAAKLAKEINALLDKQDFGSPTLEKMVRVLREMKTHVPALCGTPWLDWRERGQCQVCDKAVDCKEKGLHCEAGGHRICWACMIKKIQWVELMQAGAVSKDDLVLDNDDRMLCGSADEAAD